MTEFRYAPQLYFVLEEYVWKDGKCEVEDGSNDDKEEGKFLDCVNGSYNF